MKTLQNRIRGSLIGGAAGDALGYPVEFIDSFEGIQANYGERGITCLDVQWTDVDSTSVGKAVISDDTQMTLFTANGLLNAKRKKISPQYSICMAYIEWYLTQTGKKSSKFKDCWIASIPELNRRRAPGITCMNSLGEIYNGKEPINSSKGCGGVMRVAPVALYAAVDDRMPITEAAILAGEAAKITHHNPMGFIPAVLITYIIYQLVLDDNPTRDSFNKYLTEGMAFLYEQYPSYNNALTMFEELIDKAVTLSYNDRPDLENIQELGEGWVGDEALAIAVYCTMRHFDSFEDALIAAVNHGGDSDSTGAVCGNILGAAIGYEAIPQKFKDDLELHDVILHMADDIYRGEVTKM